MVEVFQGTEEKDKLAVIGFMGAGKGEISKRVAFLLGECLYRDLDDDYTLKNTHGLSIPKYIKKFDLEIQPLNNFRKYAESKGLRDVMYETKYTSRFVLSLGGGTLSQHNELERNLWMLKKMGFTIIYLHTELARIKEFRENDDEGNAKRIDVDEDKLYNQRLPLYQELSDIQVDNTGTISETADDFVNQYGFHKGITPIRKSIDTIDDELIERFNGTSGGGTSKYSSSKDYYRTDIVITYAERVCSEFHEKGIIFDDNVKELIYSRCEEVEKVAQLKKKYGQPALQNGRKEELENKWEEALGEKGKIIYNIIHSVSVEME